MASSVATVALAPLVFIAPTVPLALAATAAFCIATGVATATVVSLLIRRYSAQRGAVMGLNTVGLNVGTFAGASLAGVALGVGGYLWLALTLVAMALAAVGMAWVALRTLAPPDAGGQEAPATA